MARKKWQTVAYTDQTVQPHPSQPAAYTWVGQQPVGEKYRVNVDEGHGRWEWYSDVTSTADGFEES